MQARNIDSQEVEKFSNIASRWWDPHGEFKPLHEINPVRISYVERCVPLRDKLVLDVGCGGGILSESMARVGARVTGIDVAAAALEVAQLHKLESKLQLDYHLSTAEEYASSHPEKFDVVTCMEMLEHVPDPASIVAACANLVKPGGHVFFSTLNRTAKSYVLAIIGAEYVMRLLPKGTHDYKKFIRPSELEAWVRAAGLTITDIKGITYSPFSRDYALSRDIDVNYLCCARKPE